MNHYSCYTVPLQDGRLSLVVVFNGFESKEDAMTFIGDLDIYLNPEQEYGLPTFH
jgi:hypothetical protein